MQESIMRRLGLIKYIHVTAEAQSRLPEPMCLTSILMFHDVIELFLVLAAESLDISTKNRNFLDYWSLINEKIDSGNLSHKETMRRLNEARVNFKHHGTLPHQTDIDSYRASVRNFFEDSTPLIFSTEFEQISMINLVKGDAVRDHLKEAESLAKQKDWANAIINTALAFENLLSDYERSKSTYGRSPFFIGKPMTFNKGFFLGIQDRKFKKFADDVTESISNMQDAIKILMFGIDYRRYVAFRMLSPYIYRTIDGFTVSTKEIDYAEEDYQFTRDFVIESALKIQEFDFETISQKPSIREL